MKIFTGDACDVGASKRPIRSGLINASNPTPIDRRGTKGCYMRDSVINDVTDDVTSSRRASIRQTADLVTSNRPVSSACIRCIRCRVVFLLKMLEMAYFSANWDAKANFSRISVTMRITDDTPTTWPQIVGSDRPETVEHVTWRQLRHEMACVDSDVSRRERIRMQSLLDKRTAFGWYVNFSSPAATGVLEIANTRTCGWWNVRNDKLVNRKALEVIFNVISFHFIFILLCNEQSRQTREINKGEVYKNKNRTTNTSSINPVRSINPRFTYLLTYLLTYLHNRRRKYFTRTVFLIIGYIQIVLTQMQLKLYLLCIFWVGAA